MKKIIKQGLLIIMVATVMVGCTGKESLDFDLDNEISVISREDGSGTRGAFIELFNIEEKDSNGNKIDHTTKEATIAPKTDVMLTNVAGDDYAVGYVSLGSLNDSVKDLKIDGVKATSTNITNGSYKAARPFNLAINDSVTELAVDFISYILSTEGQEVVSEFYIPITGSALTYNGAKPAGKIVIAGSSSVTPIIEKLKEEYIKINPDAEIEIQMSDSTSGISSVINGTCDIAMASRELKESEREKLNSFEIALDGIAIIVNSKNSIDELSGEDVRSIFSGEKLMWSDVK